MDGVAFQGSIDLAATTFTGLMEISGSGGIGFWGLTGWSVRKDQIDTTPVFVGSIDN
jgi:hypothetical protein